MSVAVPPYGVAIHNAIARGDLAEMKRVADEAEKYLRETGDLRSALSQLKIEIAKAEKKA
jgi:hypothetical protein